MAAAIAGLAVSVASTAFSFFSGRKKAKAQEEAAGLARAAIGKEEDARKVQARVEQLKLARQRRAVAREARAARGQALQAGGSSGASISSAGIAGGIGGAESTEAASQSFLSESGIRAQEISSFLGEAANLRTGASQKSADAIAAGEFGQAVGVSGGQLAGALDTFASAPTADSPPVTQE